jgi:putative oxidoreductase
VERLFHTTRDAKTSIGLLILRVGIGALMVYGHGWGKLAHYTERSATFGDPIGLGSATSLTLAVFAEFFCSIGLVLGLATRLAVIPLITTMSVAAFVVHGGGPWNKVELPLLFLLPYLALLFSGAGRFSLDAAIAGVFARKRGLAAAPDS